MKSIAVLPVRQWVKSWEMSKWAPEEGLGEPPQQFYVTSMSIKDLRALANVSRREISERKQGTPNPGYQRPRDERRSRKIGRYIDYGYPLSSQLGLNPTDYPDLIHPGWLPTTILVNLIPVGETRRRYGQDLSVPSRLQAYIEHGESGSFLTYPDPTVINIDNRLGRDYLEPIEVIDGQHRLFAADDSEYLDDSYQVPVVLFEGLSEQWQAYLFWVINVEPKKINTSLAFDLYPELRSSTWLERGEAIKVYQEHRAQELTELLWRHPQSPWCDRIELHGKRMDGHVSNAAFIRSLTSSFIRRWRLDGRIGGLFGSIDGDGKERLIRWTRLQQAAFLIYVWKRIHATIKTGGAEWIKGCEHDFKGAPSALIDELKRRQLHSAFAGPHTLLGTDQGVRAVLVVFNALLSVAYEDLGLDAWEIDYVPEADPEFIITHALVEIEKNKEINSLVNAISETLFNSTFDWRSGAAPSVDPAHRQAQMAYKGSSGYTLLQNNALNYLYEHGAEDVKKYIGLIRARARS